MNKNNKKKLKIKKINYELLNFDYFFQRITSSFCDELTKRQFYAVKKDEMDALHEILKAYKSIFSTTSQKDNLYNCKNLLKKLKQLKKCNEKGFCNLISISAEDNLWKIQKYDGLIPSNVLKKLNEHYYLFKKYYIIERDGYNILVGKIKHWDANKTGGIYCYIDKFVDTWDLEEDFKTQQKLYRIYQFKRFLKKYIKHLILFLLLFLFICIFNIYSPFTWILIPFIAIIIAVLLA